MNLPAASALLFLAACDEAPRSLSIVEDADDPTAPWRPPETGDTAAVSTQTGAACGADLTEEEGDLALLGCARLSPEPGDEADTGAYLDTGGPALPPGAPPPCGYYNLLGAIDMAGAPTAPDLLYCDGDEDGGLRHARWSADGQLETTLLLEDTCWVDFMTGVLTPSGEDLRAWWVELASIGDTSVWTARLDGAGGFSETPVLVEGTAGARRVVVLDVDGPRLVMQDMDGALSLLDPSAGETTAIAESVWAFGAGAAGAGLVVASCDDVAMALTVTALDGEGDLLWARAIEDATCGYLSAPAVTGDAERVIVTWDDSDQGEVLVLDPDGEILARSGLGKDSLYPVASLTEDALWTVDGAGIVSRWSRDGELLGSWVHRGIAGHSGEVAGLRFRAAEEALTFTLIGMDSETAAAGHINTYYYLEASASAVPTL